MSSKRARLVIILLAGTFMSLPSFAQQDPKEQKKYKSASLDGTTGLFKVWDAEPLRHLEVNFGAGFNHLNRDPGELTIKTVPAAIAIGLFDRFEFFESVDVQKLVDASGVKTYRVRPGQLPQPATTLLGVRAFSNEAPFIDVRKANGRGDTRLGLKFNVLSERRGNPFSMSMVGFGTLPGQRSATGLNRGLSSGAFQGGYGYLFSKRAGRIAQLHLNTLVNFVMDPELNNVTLADLQHEFIYRAGAAFPTYGRFQLIGEVDGKTYFGSRPTGLNPRSPVDTIVGLRVYPREWISLGAGYRATFNGIKEDPANRVLASDPHGFVAQVAVGSRRNDPPTVTCAVANPSIKQDEQTAIRANAVDSDGDTLTYSWNSSGGRIVGSGDSVSFDATGVAPGSYTVTGTVSDGRHQVSCTISVTVIKRNLPPTVTCEPASTSVTEGETANVRANASDPNNDALTYTWTLDGQALAAAGPMITFGSEGRKAGNYTVAVTVSDGELTASCSTTVTVREKPQVNRPPTIDCLTSSVDVAAGGSVELRVQASDPDGGPVTVNWSATGGAVNGANQTATFDAKGLTAGTYTVTATADDGRGGRTSCTMTVNVSERAVLVREGRVPCGNFGPGSSRVDNCAKAMLDDISVRMKNDPRLRANIIGYTDDSQRERAMKDLGARRARAVASYLQAKGVDASRLTITDGGASNPVGDNKTAAGRRSNRRVEIELSTR